MRVSDLSSASVDALLQGRLGRPYRFVEECPSTQRLLGDDDAEGATVATDHPDRTDAAGSAGRGRTPPGRALLFSVLLRPQPPMAIWPELSLVAGEAVAAALREQTGIARRARPSERRPRRGPEARRRAAGGDSRPGRARNRRERQPDRRRAARGHGEAADVAARRDSDTSGERAPLLAAILLELERRYDDWQRLHTNR